MVLMVMAVVVVWVDGCVVVVVVGWQGAHDHDLHPAASHPLV